jgi:hypothetical protein
LRHYAMALEAGAAETTSVADGVLV